MSGLAIKRKHAKPKHRTPTKRVLAARKWEEIMFPIVKRVKKLSKGQIRRNVRKAYEGWGNPPEKSKMIARLLGRPPRKRK